MEHYHNLAIELLQAIIPIRSYSYEEAERAEYLVKWLAGHGIKADCIGNNIWAKQVFDPDAPTLMLCAHIDTVPAVDSYTFDPIHPPMDQERILGLGSNDDGGSLVSMITTFLYFKECGRCPVNLLLLLSCEEERSGDGGTRMLGEFISANADMAIIGEPTRMRATIAESGLLVLDGVASGKSAHAARAAEGENALYKAIDDINKLRSFKFDRVSPTLGEVKLVVTQINSGMAHNVIPDNCTFVVDIRPNECYDNHEIVNMLQKEIGSKLTARNFANRSNATPKDSPLYKTAGKLGMEMITSPTCSDWISMPVPAIKIGPGDSTRSHKADEFIFKNEITEGIDKYITFIENIAL
ncbi:MAG: M20/M25/M40 family metallo-hydrolase [Bacteroidales bacterium]|nr:M20/M25/M40 family metallo-hydrolase [Bacteroidales bacterium]